MIKLLQKVDEKVQINLKYDIIYKNIIIIENLRKIVITQLV